jgi:hypothetical protein
MAVVVFDNRNFELPDAFSLKETHIFNDEVAGRIQIERDELVMQLEDDGLYYSNGLCLIHIKYILEHSNIFEPCMINKLKQIENK